MTEALMPFKPVRSPNTSVSSQADSSVKTPACRRLTSRRWQLSTTLVHHNNSDSFSRASAVMRTTSRLTAAFGWFESGPILTLEAALNRASEPGLRCSPFHRSTL